MKRLEGDELVTTVYATLKDGQRTWIAGYEVHAKHLTWQNIPLVRSPKRPNAYRLVLLCNLRIVGVERTIQGRHNGPCDTDDGEVYFHVALIHMAARQGTNYPLNSLAWAEQWVPLLIADKGEAWFAEQERAVLALVEAGAGIPSSGEMAKALALTNAERKAFVVRGCCAIDRSSEQLAADEKKANAARMKAGRAKAGATPREESVTARHARGEFGDVSLKTVQRRIKAEKLKAEAEALAATETVLVLSVGDVRFSCGTVKQGKSKSAWQEAPDGRGILTGCVDHHQGATANPTATHEDVADFAEAA